MTIHEKLSLIQKEFKAKKSRYNSFGKYNFRSAEDILEALKPVNQKHGVYFTVTEELVESSSLPIIKTTATIFDTETDAKIIATAIVGVDLAQKGMQVPQQFGSTSSYAKKYALGNLLLIDDTADSDATNTHNSTKPKLRKGSDNWEAALKYINSGGKITSITSKYEVSSDDLLTLKVHEQK